MNSENGDSPERWLRPLHFGVFLALALFACFPQVLLGLESFFTRDYGVLAYPNIQFHRDCFWRGELPMWNPYSNCGQPFLAQWGTMTLYPGALIYLLLPLPGSLSLFCFAHVWLGGFGMYLLARHWTNNNFAGALAGTAYVFNGIMFASFVWPNYLVTLGWMPFVVMLAVRAWREDGRWLVGAALVATLQMLSGAPEVILFTWLIVVALWICDALRTPAATFSFLRRMLVVVLLTSGLMAVQLLPFFELLQMSHRAPGFAGQKWQFPLWGWANFFVPLYNAFETPAEQYWQYGQNFLSSVYLGGLGFAFALVALFRWPDTRIWMLSALAGLSLVLAFGDQTPVFPGIQKVIPLIGIARYPVKFIFVLAFIVPLLAGCGAAAVMKSRLRAGMFAAALLVLAIYASVSWAARGQRFVDYASWPKNFRQNVEFSWTKASEGKNVPDALANTVGRVLMFIAAAVTLSAVVRGRKASPALAYAALALVAADVRMHSPRQNPTLPSRLFAPRQSSNLPPLGQGRAMIVPQDEEFLTYLASADAARVWQAQRFAEWSNLNLLDEVSKVNGSSTLQTREQRQVEENLYTMTNRLPARLLDFLAVKFVTTNTSSNHMWINRPSALPLVSAGQKPVFADERQALSMLMDGSLDFSQSVCLLLSIREKLQATNATAATVTNVAFSANTVEANVFSPEETLFVVAQSHFPAWRATVDGSPVSLFVANVAFQAVPIPAGQHHVRLVYSDARFRIGAVISVLSLVLCGFAWWRIGKAQRRNPS